MTAYKITLSKEANIKGIKFSNNKISEFYISMPSDKKPLIIEKLEVPNYGDICYAKDIERIFVFGDYKYSVYCDNAAWRLEKNSTAFKDKQTYHNVRLAVDEEKEIFKEVLAKDNIRWDEKAKCFIEGLRWRALVGGAYFYIGENFIVQKCSDFRHEYDNIKFENGNYFRTKKDAQKALRHLLQNDRH